MSRLDLTGAVFDRLTVLEHAGKDNKGNVLWRCRCSCGGELVTYTLMLRTGKKKSCGCLRREKSAQHCRKMTKHGHWSNGKPSSEYAIWSSMKARCSNPRHKQYKDYGGRGITVCPEWADSFERFLADMGARPDQNSSIDRIDNNLGYSPSNCRWATSKQQNNNNRGNRMLTIQGETKSYQQWCDQFGITRERLKRAMQYTDSAEAALRDAVWRDLTGDRTRRG